MIRLVITLLTLLAGTAVGFAAEQPPPRTDRIAIIIIPSWSPDSSDSPNSFRVHLLQSIDNHLSHYLLLRGDHFQITRLSGSVSSEIALGTLETGRYSGAVCVRVRGSISREPGVVTDPHRRRRFAMFEECLDVNLNCTRFVQDGPDWRENGQLTLSETGQPMVDQLSQISSRGTRCEPFEHVVQRAVEGISDILPRTEAPTNIPAKTLPLKLYLSSNLTESGPRQTDLERIVRVASEHLKSEFGAAIRLISVDTLDDPAGRQRSLRNAFASLRNRVPLYSDTLTVLVNRLLSRDQYFGKGWTEEVGLTQLGRKRTAIDLLPAASSGDSVWFAVENGLVLLHELGHTFGAIHVSDMNSVMTPRATWVATARMDPINRKIVRAALGGELTFSDPAEYLGFVSETIAETPYQLSDYPAFLAQFLDNVKSLSTRHRMRAAIKRSSFLDAIDGYTALQAGREERAAALFRRALKADPHQASLYYYLSLALDGPEARALMQTAADMGFLSAFDVGGGEDSVDIPD